MKSWGKYVLMFIVIGELFPHEASGIISAGYPGALLAKNVQSSTSIVCGRVAKLRSERDGLLHYKQNEFIEGRWQVYDVTIDCHITGHDVGSSVALEIFKPHGQFALIFDELQLHHRYVFCFGERQANGNYRLIDHLHSVLQISDHPQQSGVSGKNALLTELNAALREDMPAITLPVLHSLRPLGISYSQIVDVLKALTYSEHPRIAAHTLTTRLFFHDVEALSDLVELAPHYSESQSGWVRYGLMLWKEKKGLDQMIALTNSQNVTVRRGAAHALRMLGDETHLPILEKLLVDEDIEVSYEAIMGLARITDSYQGLTTSYEKFPEERTKLLQRWKQKLKHVKERQKNATDD